MLLHFTSHAELSACCCSCSLCHSESRLGSWVCGSEHSTQPSRHPCSTQHGSGSSFLPLQNPGKQQGPWQETWIVFMAPSSCPSSAAAIAYIWGVKHRMGAGSLSISMCLSLKKKKKKGGKEERRKTGIIFYSVTKFLLINSFSFFPSSLLLCCLTFLPSVLFVPPIVSHNTAPVTILKHRNNHSST